MSERAQTQIVSEWDMKNELFEKKLCEILHYSSGNISMKFVSLQVDMTKVRLEVIKPWVTEKITTILGIEDDVVIEYVFNQLEAEKVS